MLPPPPPADPPPPLADDEPGECCCGGPAVVAWCGDPCGRPPPMTDGPPGWSTLKVPKFPVPLPINISDGAAVHSFNSTVDDDTVRLPP